MTPRRARHAAVVLLAAGLGLSGCAGAKRVNAQLGTVQGTGSFRTNGLTAVGAWDEEYEWDCTKQVNVGLKNADGFALTLFNLDDDAIAAENPSINRKGRSGKGLFHVKRSGVYYSVIVTPCDWKLIATDRSQG